MGQIQVDEFSFSPNGNGGEIRYTLSVPSGQVWKLLSIEAYSDGTGSGDFDLLVGIIPELNGNYNTMAGTNLELRGGNTNGSSVSINEYVSGYEHIAIKNNYQNDAATAYGRIVYRRVL